MSIEARLPPAQYGLRLKRMLGGKAGWNGVILQILFVAVLVWVGYEIVANARSNLAAQRITSGFGFLNNTAGFDVNQALISYSGSDSYSRVLLVGILLPLGLAPADAFS
ncbi:MAG: amino acid ABC transporter permease, partial [Bradyrhizobium sp.]|nr:amino acid ABC transporter permease [Bradyrhizobium sp.]